MTWRDESKGGANGGRPNAKRDKASILRLKGAAMAGRAKPPWQSSAPPGLGVQRIVGGWRLVEPSYPLGGQTTRRLRLARGGVGTEGRTSANPLPGVSRGSEAGWGQPTDCLLEGTDRPLKRTDWWRAAIVTRTPGVAPRRAARAIIRGVAACMTGA